ncbi:GNAT family N-acetyltransferase [Rhizobium tumorigenes]|uniref:GNAT family N-acetyltransferase n=1 Tax=Rhizobium tumorigenes TaxID=2041385 RepID=A0AAF1K4R9_9HYPH|nr:GNAT family N-acetyltransferase [Rhizobium tumorigenes]WFR95416.1 GNAT family N-acetyltransferase [Rhizobium tumorigenes]
MIDIRMLDADQARGAGPQLAEILVDCVEDGASLGFMHPFDVTDALPFWIGVADDVASGKTLLFVAEIDGEMVGTVQIGFASMPNQRHRGDLKKLLVHRSARGKGVSRLLTEAAEQEAARHGKSLLVLDTATGSAAEAIYPRLGWNRVGIIPDYAAWPQGGLGDVTLFYKRIGLPAA